MKLAADFGLEWMIAFAAYITSYVAFSWQILSNQSHGSTAKWEEMLKKLVGFINNNGITHCTTSSVLAVPYLCFANDGPQLRTMLKSSIGIRTAIVRLRLLRDRFRMLAFGLLLSSVLAFLVISPELYGEVKWTPTYPVAYATYVAITALFFGLTFNLPHAVLWSRLQDEKEEADRRYTSGSFQPIGSK
jgi:hypothetical protein